jgi:hypothetical protein
MDYNQFLANLPALSNGWGRESVRPKAARFQQVLHHVPGMTSANVLQLLNAAVACLEADEVYCEIGSFQGATLIGALLDNAPRRALAADNFSEFDPQGHNAQTLRQNLTRFGVAERVAFCPESFEQFFERLRSMTAPLESRLQAGGDGGIPTTREDRLKAGRQRPRIGVYLYDAAHDYRPQLLGLLFARPFRADRALVIVDDSNESAVQQANRDFVATHAACRLLLDLATPGNGHPTFWNGLQLLAWDRT